ncbi:hypothetical protein DJ568_02705 [Mucilaginibacter hurinus]|uniref:DUF418 domain-containing protein n=1 Tax=Mucilaginibacter hurinus TaxID=2201324 RepID=A0A367GTN9_9SPHI|nr:DUF418 domain-containing protein [Mucilaginibacter hurinus]RCH56784.1 hypothetical protein DJ568_02705 [Mucilaginibacter hurinus]
MATVTAYPKIHKTTDRIDVIDVLRGFALLGIIIVHCTFSYGAMQLPLHSRFDNILLQLVNYLIEGKFYAIFSFIFGLSFAIQLQSAEAKKRRFTGYFIWRSLILFVIGCLHLQFYTGDVLYKYALLGLLLLPANKLNNAALIGLGVMMIFFMPYLRKLPDTIYPKQTTAADMQARKEYNASKAELAINSYNAKTAGSLNGVLKTNRTLIAMFWRDIQDIYFLILGLFLLGLAAGRKKLFICTEPHRRFFTWTMIIGLTAAAVLFFLRKPPAAWASLITTLNQIALAGVYVSAVTLLYWSARVSALLNIFSPVGKMGLTTYLLQSAFGLIFFFHFGFGMVNRLGVGQAIGVGISFYIIQVLFARWWMSRFRFGPVEWLWRSLTYLKIQPLRRY